MRAGMCIIHNCHINYMYSTLDCIKGCYMMYVDHSLLYHRDYKMISTIIAVVLVGVATASVYETDDRKYSKLCFSVPMT